MEDRLMKFAVVFPWPGTKNAEFELIKRILISASKQKDIHAIVVDNSGIILDQQTLDYLKNGEREPINSKDLDFVLSMHYQSDKTIDSFWYTANWNPPELMLRDTQYADYRDNLLNTDDFLTYDSRGMNDFLRMLLLGDKRNIPDYLENTTYFLPSTPELGLNARLRNDRMLFYCGINWEKCSGEKGRHQDIFKLLDGTSYMRIYGPHKFLGIRPWAGFKSYQCSIPFDGVSLIHEINKCGAALLLSSDVHRRAGAASSRLYEACAAGAVIISDDNAFVKKHFGDCALFITYDKEDGDYTFRQIDEKMRWINDNPEEAFRLASKAQAIWREKMTLDSQIRNLCDGHRDRMSLIQGLFAAQKKDEPIDIVVLWDLPKTDGLEEALRNIQNQSYETLCVHIVCDQDLEAAVRNKTQTVLGKIPAKIHPLPVYYRKNRALTKGQMFSAVRSSLTADYFIIMGDDEIWFKDHVTSLKRVLEDKKEAGCSYGKNFHKNGAHIHKGTNRKIDARTIQKSLPITPAGAFLFRSSILEEVDDCVYENLDGFEACVFMLYCLSKGEHAAAFSGRMTIGRTDKAHERRYLLSVFEQVNIINGLFADTLFHSSSADKYVAGTLDVMGFEKSLMNYLYWLLGKQSMTTFVIKKLYRAVRSLKRGK